MSWFKRDKRSGATLALCPLDGGVAAASVSRPAGAQPVLEWARFIAGSGDGRRAALGAALRQQPERGRVTGLLPLEAYNLLLVEAPDVPVEEQRQAVRWRVKDLIDFPIEEAVVDVFDVPPAKGGREGMLYAVVARKAAVRAVIDEIELQELPLASVDIPELAIRNLASLVPEDVGGVAFLYLEDERGLITISRQGTLYLSRRFDGGSRRLLAAGTGEVGAAHEGLLDAVVIEIQRSLDYYESQFAQPPVQGVVIAPLPQALAGVDAYLGSQLGVPVRMLALDQLIESASALEADDAARCLTAVGAALRDEEAAA
ncbi:MAG: hypothetical protein ACU85V_11515 [Gammaproteobacteria bacterium]